MLELDTLLKLSHLKLTYGDLLPRWDQESDASLARLKTVEVSIGVPAVGGGAQNNGNLAQWNPAGFERMANLEAVRLDFRGDKILVIKLNSVLSLQRLRHVHIDLQIEGPAGFWSVLNSVEQVEGGSFTQIEKLKLKVSSTGLRENAYVLSLYDGETALVPRFLSVFPNVKVLKLTLFGCPGCPGWVFSKIQKHFLGLSEIFFEPVVPALVPRWRELLGAGWSVECNRSKIHCRTTHSKEIQ